MILCEDTPTIDAESALTRREAARDVEDLPTEDEL